MEAIKPILRHMPGEVVINFMYDYVNRFLSYTNPQHEESLDLLFGTKEWRALRSVEEDKEHAIVDYYRERVREAGRYRFVTSTRILKPTHDRAYYHLVYATRNPKGIIEFRAVEKKVASEQGRVRWTAKRQAREDRTQQPELELGFVHSSTTEPDQEKATQLQLAEERIAKLLKAAPLDYEDIRPQVLEIPLVWDSDLQDILRKMRESGKLEIAGLGPRGRTVKSGCRLRLL